MEDKIRLSLIVKKDIWLEIKHMEDTGRWVTYKPKMDNGFIEKNTILILYHMFKGLYNFIEIKPENYEPESEADIAEFSDDDIKNLFVEDAVDLVRAP